MQCLPKAGLEYSASRILLSQRFLVLMGDRDRIYKAGRRHRTISSGPLLTIAPRLIPAQWPCRPTRRGVPPLEVFWKSTRLPRHHLFEWNCQILTCRPPRALILFVATILLYKLPKSRRSATRDTGAECLPLDRPGGKTAVESLSSGAQACMQRGSSPW